jgi:hypothetical protein
MVACRPLQLPVLVLACMVLAACAASKPATANTVVLSETFDNLDAWRHSEDGGKGRFIITNGQLEVKPCSLGRTCTCHGTASNECVHAQMPTASRHYGLSRPLAAPLDPAKGLVLQYEVNHTKGHNCGGSYIKLLTQQEDGAISENQGYSSACDRAMHHLQLSSCSNCIG